MRIILLCETFAPQMGYIENMLPKHLARCGAEVHIVTTSLPPYHYVQECKNMYKDLAASGKMAETTEVIEGITIHRLGYRKVLGYVKMVGLISKLRQLKPDIVQGPALGWLALDAAIAKVFMGFKLFTATHVGKSVFPLAQHGNPFRSLRDFKNYIIRFLPGRLVSLVTEKCYSPTSDCGEIAWKFLGIQKHKVKVVHLGVDTDLFCPLNSDMNSKRSEIRSQLGFGSDDIVIIYTGKLITSKNPLILAEAVQKLRDSGYKYSALFIGEGTIRSKLENKPYCKILPFMPHNYLPEYYQSADIAVWPTNESISMLDAIACGLPIVISDLVSYREHIEGNGLVFHCNDINDLTAKLLSLNDLAVRLTLGSAGAAKMQASWSWRHRAEQRLLDYARAIT